MAEPGVVRYRREMGFSRKEFLRLLPRAMGEHAWEWVGDDIHATIHQGTLVIQIGDEQRRRIHLLDLPYLPIDFEFRDVSEEQHDAFRRYFDLRYQRGGG